MTSIGYAAFEGCSSLTSVTIPNSVTSIGYGAFQECIRLTSLTIPNSVTFIDELAFFWCISLKDVFCYAENVPRTPANAFYDTYIAKTILHVPVGSVDDYKAAEPWKNFKEIVAIDEETTDYDVIQLISTYNGLQGKNDSYYNLQGQRVDNPTKGLYMKLHNP